MIRRHKAVFILAVSSGLGPVGGTGVSRDPTRTSRPLSAHLGWLDASPATSGVKADHTNWTNHLEEERRPYEEEVVGSAALSGAGPFFRSGPKVGLFMICY